MPFPVRTRVGCCICFVFRVLDPVGFSLKARIVHGTLVLPGIHGHVFQQIQATDVDALVRHGDVGILAHVLEEGWPGRQIPHGLIGVAPVTAGLVDALAESRVAVQDAGRGGRSAGYEDRGSAGIRDITRG